MLFQRTLGIDIGDGSVSLVCLKASFRGVKLAGHGIYPVSGAQTTQETADQIGGLVRDFLRKNRIAPTGVFLGVPRDLAILRYVDLPLAVKENLRETLGYEMEKYVPFSADEIYFDFQIIEQDKETDKMRLLLIVVKKEAVAPFFQLANQVRVGISGMEINSTAIANYFFCQPKREGNNTHAFVYLKGDALEAGLVKDGLLTYSRSVSLGGGRGDFPEIVSQEFKMLREELGRHQDRLEVVLCGPQEQETITCLGDEGDLDVHLVDLSNTGLSSFAAIPAYGLALKGSQKVCMDINIMPEDLRKKASKMGYYTMFVLAGLVLLSALAWGGGNVLQHKLALDRLDAEIKRLSIEVGKIDRLKKECKGLEDRIDSLRTIQGGRVPILNVLLELSQRIPKTAWVSGLNFSDKGVEVEGRADSASELIPLLDASPVFHDVVFLSAITKSRDGKERFRIGLKLR